MAFDAALVPYQDHFRELRQFVDHVRQHITDIEHRKPRQSVRDTALDVRKIGARLTSLYDPLEKTKNEQALREFDTLIKQFLSLDYRIQRASANCMKAVSGSFFRSEKGATVGSDANSEIYSLLPFATFVLLNKSAYFQRHRLLISQLKSKHAITVPQIEFYLKARGLKEHNWKEVLRLTPVRRFTGYSRGNSAKDKDLVRLSKCIPSSLPQLLTVDLSDCYDLTDAGVTPLLASCRGIEILDLTFCMKLTDATARAIAQNCPHLRILNLSFLPKITDAGVQEIASKCRRLFRLELGDSKNVTDSAVKSFTQGRRSLVVIIN